MTNTLLNHPLVWVAICTIAICYISFKIGKILSKQDPLTLIGRYLLTFIGAVASTLALYSPSFDFSNELMKNMLVSVSIYGVAACSLIVGSFMESLKPSSIQNSEKSISAAKFTYFLFMIAILIASCTRYTPAWWYMGLVFFVSFTSYFIILYACMNLNLFEDLKDLNQRKNSLIQEYKKTIEEVAQTVDVLKNSSKFIGLDLISQIVELNVNSKEGEILNARTELEIKKREIKNDSKKLFSEEVRARNKVLLYGFVLWAFLTLLACYTFGQPGGLRFMSIRLVQNCSIVILGIISAYGFFKNGGSRAKHKKEIELFKNDLRSFEFSDNEKVRQN